DPPGAPRLAQPGEGEGCRGGRTGARGRAGQRPPGTGAHRHSAGSASAGRVPRGPAGLSWLRSRFAPPLDDIPTGRHHEVAPFTSPTGATMSPDHPPGLDLDRLRGLLDRERPGLVNGPLSGRLIEGGRSNLTYAVGDGTAQ